MGARLRLVWEALRTSYWFVPALMATVSVGAALLLLHLDRTASEDGPLGSLSVLYSGGAQGARLVLSTIASSMITVAGVVFSVTIVALAQASAQFGPRLLRNFVRDRGNQIVLGTFTSTFLYCLLVLRKVVAAGEDGDRTEFVPQLAVAGAVVLALLGVGVLIYFIHHVARTIQAPHVTHTVAGELDRAIDALFPEEIGDAPVDEPPPPERPSGEGRTVVADGAGYVMAMEQKRLVSLATDGDLVVELLCRPGDFVVRDRPVLRVWPAQRVDDGLAARFRDAVVLGSQRSLTEDMEFALDQLVEVALRALSPGVNDPYTAANCVDWLGSGLARLAGRRMPPAGRLDDAGRLRVIAHRPGFPDTLARAFDPIRECRDTAGIVEGQLLRACERIGARARRPEDRAAVERQVQALRHSSLRRTKRTGTTASAMT